MTEELQSLLLAKRRLTATQPKSKMKKEHLRDGAKVDSSRAKSLKNNN